MNKHPEPLFQKRTFSPPGRINFANIFITPPKTFQFDLGVAGKQILTLSALYRSCQFLPLSDRTIIRTCQHVFLRLFYNSYIAKMSEISYLFVEIITCIIRKVRKITYETLLWLSWFFNPLLSYFPFKIRKKGKNYANSWVLVRKYVF